jgi:putative hydrolase of the HAD superfamily
MHCAIKGCVFDFGGVMTTVSAPERVMPILRELDVPWDVVKAGFSKYRALMDADKMSIREMYARIFAEAGFDVQKPDVERIVVADMASFMYPNMKTLEWMRRVKAGGFKIGILTNMSTELAALIKAHFGDFICLADAVVISGEEGIYKPQREIYDLMRERIALPAESLCFIDDSTVNCAGAKDAGWNASILFRNTEQAEHEFTELTGTR